MPPPSNQMLTVAQMQAAEQALISAGSSVDQLMQIAGHGAAEWVWRVAAGRAVTVLCGPGNNGGDGYVIAEELRRGGLPVTVVAPVEPATPAALNARGAYQGSIDTSGTGTTNPVLVDCLFGSGLSRPLSNELLELLQSMAENHTYRIAVDLPSGISSDDGTLLNEGLPHYDLTLALGAWKYAHWLMPASARMGIRKLIPIGVSAVEGAARLVEKPLLSAPDWDAHKYRRGLCVIVGGEMPSAALLASAAAIHAGAGYLKLASEVDLPMAAVDLVIDDQALADKRMASLLIGPGLGRNEAARAKLIEALDRKTPTVLDADALMLLKPDMLAKERTYIATPHQGELEQLCKSFAIPAGGKVQRACALAKVSGMVIVAKGPDTIIASPYGRAAVAPSASSWLSIAGTGDVLAGIIGSRLATGARPFDAACEGVWLHGEAARLAGGPFTASELAGKVMEAYAACL